MQPRSRLVRDKRIVVVILSYLPITIESVEFSQGVSYRGFTVREVLCPVLCAVPVGIEPVMDGTGIRLSASTNGAHIVRYLPWQKSIQILL